MAAVAVLPVQRQQGGWVVGSQPLLFVTLATNHARAVQDVLDFHVLEEVDVLGQVPKVAVGWVFDPPADLALHAPLDDLDAVAVDHVGCLDLFGIHVRKSW